MKKFLLGACLGVATGVAAYKFIKEKDYLIDDWLTSIEDMKNPVGRMAKKRLMHKYKDFYKDEADYEKVKIDDLDDFDDLDDIFFDEFEDEFEDDCIGEDGTCVCGEHVSDGDDFFVIKTSEIDESVKEKKLEEQDDKTITVKSSDIEEK